jgi:SAM-dependent methyltransferase
MLGLHDAFTYLHCEACGSLSLLGQPQDMSRYYPPANYYSFGATKDEAPPGFRDRLCERYLRMTGIRPLDTALIRSLCPSDDSRILDVGSGSGQKLATLWRAGYRQLCGVDPFLPEGMERQEPFALKRCGVTGAGGNWDLIMYHHVLEHVADPDAEIALAAAQLRPGGKLLIRIPVADSWAFARYGKHWVQLDAPRHFCLLTRAALIQIGRKHGLKTLKNFDDSTPFQIWASRIYAKTSRSFMDPGNAYVRSGRDMLRWFPSLAWQSVVSAWLNTIKRGDQSCFVLTKTEGA